MELIHSFGLWVSQRRRALRMTQHEVAGLVNCSVALIRKIEADERHPSPQIAELLARALHIAPDDVRAFVHAARAELAPDRLPAPETSSYPASPPTNNLFSYPRSRGNLPVAISSFLGRVRELTDLEQLLTRPEVRLLTLTGVGGSGKTRLALQAAEAQLSTFPQGIWFVDLAPLNDPAQALMTIMQSLGVAEDSNVPPRNRLINWLRPRHMLLLIDNFEHLLAAAPLISDDLQHASKLRVLITSRVPLHLQGEQEYLVLPLELPQVTEIRGQQGEGSGIADRAGLPDRGLQSAYPDALRLFLTRSQEVRPDLTISGDELIAAAQICIRLDGLPLAIELAAARPRMFSPTQLLKRLESYGTLAMLTTGPRDLPARQQTVRATIAWSYHLLGLCCIIRNRW